MLPVVCASHVIHVGDDYFKVACPIILDAFVAEAISGHVRHPPSQRVLSKSQLMKA